MFLIRWENLEPVDNGQTVEEVVRLEHAIAIGLDLALPDASAVEDTCGPMGDGARDGELDGLAFFVR